MIGNTPEEAVNSLSGVLVVDKPIGLTSHDVVQEVRNGTKLRRAGHTGTLDPRASGVLVVLIGPAVRLSEYVSATDKRYQAVLQLGATTDTYDADGKITSNAVVNITEEQFQTALNKFVGEIEQVPPPYSAVKVKGRKSYELARKGEAVELPPRKINVYKLELLDWDPPEAVLDIDCSSGTYVRSLANDLGKELGCGAHLIGLRRTKSGKFTLRNAVSLSTLKEAFVRGDWYQYIIPASEALPDWPVVELTPDQADTIRYGNRIPAASTEHELAKGMDDQGELVAILELLPESQEWKPKKVLFQ